MNGGVWGGPSNLFQKTPTLSVTMYSISFYTALEHRRGFSCPCQTSLLLGIFLAVRLQPRTLAPLILISVSRSTTYKMTEPIQLTNGHVVSTDGSAPKQANATAVDRNDDAAGLKEKQANGKGFEMDAGQMKALTEPPKFDNVQDERRYLKERLVAALRIFAMLGYE